MKLISRDIIDKDKDNPLINFHSSLLSNIEFLEFMEDMKKLSADEVKSKFLELGEHANMDKMNLKVKRILEYNLHDINKYGDKYEIPNFECMINNAKEQIDFDSKIIKKFAKGTVVNVELFYSNGRSSYEKVLKVGKNYYSLNHGRCINKHFSKEIDVITDEMSNEMLSDNYYY